MQCFSALDVVHTTQRKAWCDHATMMKWIEEVWTPTADGCRMLMLDSLRVHKMESPMDVSVMRSFESNIQDLYREWHRDHELSKKANQRRLLLSHIIVGPRDANEFRQIIRRGVTDTYLDVSLEPYVSFNPTNTKRGMVLSCGSGAQTDNL
ncbi:hypothetical protein PC120_g8984 [Phytophthora cactorum]|nr:hypothetical protein PC120_g8984 [Phytophthora cactorum]KAG3088288.1 hypothetical protein PC122_g8463 [Phytophthora cactorum]